MNVSKILGESEPEFSEQFKGVLTLMNGLRDLSDTYSRNLTRRFIHPQPIWPTSM